MPRRLWGAQRMGEHRSDDTDFGDQFEIGRVITIVEVTGPDGNVTIRVRASQLPWVTLGMLDWAKKSLNLP